MVLNGRWWKESSIVGNSRGLLLLGEGKRTIIRVPFGSLEKPDPKWTAEWIRSWCRVGCDPEGQG